MAFIKKGGKSLHGKKSISFYHINSNMYSCISLCIELLQFKNEHEASHSIICRIAFCCCDKREEIAYQSGSKKKEEGIISFFFLLSFYRNIYMYLFDEHGEYKKEENKKHRINFIYKIS